MNGYTRGHGCGKALQFPSIPSRPVHISLRMMVDDDDDDDGECKKSNSSGIQSTGMTCHSPEFSASRNHTAKAHPIPPLQIPAVNDPSRPKPPPQAKQKNGRASRSNSPPPHPPPPSRS